MIQGLKIAMLVGYLRVHPAVAIRTIPKGGVVHDNRRWCYSLFCVKLVVEPLLLLNPHVNTLPETC